MTTRLLTVVLRTALLVALMASTVMFVDYSSIGEPAFCGVQSGCAAVRDSAYSEVFGIPLPNIGLGVFAGLFATAAWASRERHLKLVVTQCVAAAVGAAVLIAVQIFTIGAICKWCMAVDVSAIVAALSAIALARRKPDREPRAQRFLWAGAGVVAVALPLLWPHSTPTADLPAGVAQQQQRGKVSIIMFTDFQCPFCRVFHGVVGEVVRSDPERFHLVRLMRPLASHPGAEPAALAYMCSPEDHREEMADKLYAGTPAELTAAGVKDMAVSLGIDAAAYDACVADAATRARLEGEIALFKEAQLRGLPSTFVGEELVLGADVKAFELAVAHALEGRGTGSGVLPMLGLLALIFGGVAVVSLRAAAGARKAA